MRKAFVLDELQLMMIPQTARPHPTTAEVVVGRGFLFKCAIIAAFLTGIAIVGGTVVGAIIGTRDKPTNGTPSSTLAPTLDLRFRCEE
jgi:hypothetical protein